MESPAYLALVAQGRYAEGLEIHRQRNPFALGKGDMVLREAVHNLLDAGNKKLLINLGAVTTIDSSGVGELVSAFTTAVEYLTRLLDVTPKSNPTRCALALKLADAHYFQSDYSAARAAIGQAQAAATTDTDRAPRWRCWVR